MNNVKITDIKVTLCDTRVKGNFADSTRQVETIGFAVVEVSSYRASVSKGLRPINLGLMAWRINSRMASPPTSW